MRYRARPVDAGAHGSTSIRRGSRRNDDRDKVRDRDDPISHVISYIEIDDDGERRNARRSTLCTSQGLA
jgi:hypothetical protein